MRRRVRWVWLLAAAGILVVGYAVLAPASTYTCMEMAGTNTCGPTVVDWIQFGFIVAATVAGVAYSVYRAFRRATPN